MAGKQPKSLWLSVRSRRVAPAVYPSPVWIHHFNWPIGFRRNLFFFFWAGRMGGGGRKGVEIQRISRSERVSPFAPPDKSTGIYSTINNSHQVL
jgi:hypothetical protein